jgi:hypothetical protein
MRYSAGAAAALVVMITFGFAAGAAAGSLSNAGGTVTLASIGIVTADTPYASGQIISVTLHANSALGFDNGAAGPYNFEECQAPNGVLPTVPTSNCDGSTIVQVSAVNADGSLGATSFKIYALPDVPTFGEDAGAGQPNCGLAPNDCVLYIGSPIGADTSFPTAHLFSAPFVIASNSDDKGENPGDGSGTSGHSTGPVPVVAPQVNPKPKATPASTAGTAATQAGATAPSSSRGAPRSPASIPNTASSNGRSTTTSSVGTSSLAFTGASPTLAWIALFGAFLVLASSFALRRARHGIDSPGP